MADFKVGQKVRLRCDHQDLRKGCVGSVASISLDDLWVEILTEVGWRSLPTEHLEIVADVIQGEGGGNTTSPTTASDPVHRPHHYARFKREPVEFIMENDLPFWCGSVIKYVLRYDAKDGLQDLKKARRYLDIKIKQLEGDENFAK